MVSIGYFCSKLFFCCLGRGKHEDNRKDELEVYIENNIKIYQPSNEYTGILRDKQEIDFGRESNKRELTSIDDNVNICKNLNQNIMGEMHKNDKTFLYYDKEEEKNNIKNFLNPKDKMIEIDQEKNLDEKNNKKSKANKKTAKISPSKNNAEETLVEMDFFTSPFITDEQKKSLKVYSDSNKSMKEILDKKKNEKDTKKITCSDNMKNYKTRLTKLKETKNSLKMNYEKSQVKDVLEKLYQEDENLKFFEEKYALALCEKEDDNEKQYIRIFSSNLGKITKDNEYLTRKIFELNYL